MEFTLQTLQTIIQQLKVVADFLIIWVLVYYVLKIVRNNSRTVQIFKGIILIVVMHFIATKMNLTTTASLLGIALQYGLLAFVVIFQPEIRNMLERLGKTSVFSTLHSLSGNEKERLVDELVEATRILSQRKTGALITIEQGHSLTDYIKTGKVLNSAVTSDLLTSIFVTSTPLHDGAVIIQGDRIAAASAYFPPTTVDLPTKYGARHRAAIGISEMTDSITIVVSEETGTISIAEGGRLREMDESSLRDYLNLVIQNMEKEVSHAVSTRRARRLNLSKLNIDPIKIEKINADDIMIKDFDEEQEDNMDVSRLMNIFKRKPKEPKVKKATEETPKASESAKKPAEEKPKAPDESIRKLFKKHKVEDEVSATPDTTLETPSETAVEAPIETIVEETIEETPTKVKASKKKTSTTKKDDVDVEKVEETTLDVTGDVAKTTKTKSTKTKKVTDTKTVVKEVKEEASETVIPSETEGGNDNE
ncbi:diadenylate cyclase CdaA [Erysipelothrix anatis]|uniref:diadenylate cyclase CdaA n=1 Tax=Erysipelothrix anatis TaxID=2683713 RepID=UPI0013589B7C|nr:diadenylate cyclase CdaA [Erysipelothrix anatis]